MIDKSLLYMKQLKKKTKGNSIYRKVQLLAMVGI